MDDARRNLVTFQWSKNAWHIQSVFPPWQEQDGYALPILVAAEQSLGIPLPMLLKNFYHAWGRRTDLTRARETLLNPDQLTVRSRGLIFTEENQAVYVWAIPYTALQRSNPPVYYAELVPEPAELQWLPSHTHLSDFFDYLTYGHAFASGAPHGGVSCAAWSEALHAAITQRWNTIELVSCSNGVTSRPRLAVGFIWGKRGRHSRYGRPMGCRADGRTPRNGSSTDAPHMEECVVSAVAEVYDSMFHHTNLVQLFHQCIINSSDCVEDCGIEERNGTIIVLNEQADFGTTQNDCLSANCNHTLDNIKILLF